MGVACGVLASICEGPCAIVLCRPPITQSCTSMPRRFTNDDNKT